MKKFFKIVLGLLMVAVFAWVVFYLYNQSKKSPVVFQTESPKVTDIVKKTVATGSVVPRQEIEIKPQESGIITEIYVEPGDKLKKGDLIAKIQIIPEMVQVNNAESQLEKAQIRFKNAELEFNRKKELYKSGVIAESVYLEEQMAYDNAKVDLQAADNNLQLIKEGVTKKMGAHTNTIIKATIEGMVLDVPVEVGNSVIKSNTFNDGTTVAILADMGEMIFEGKVDETEVGKIKEGMDLVLSIGAIENEKFDAKLEYISPKGVEENGAIQFEIKADVNLKEGQFIRAGYSANADIVLDKRDRVLAINEKLLQFSNDTAFIEVEVADQIFEKKFIETGLSDGIQIEVKQGLTKDDKIKVPQS
ncbi:efflux RND transporter periplasmic adaptor subunit [Plebeiibacterium sediminum]|uniref:Efflux RND transporter periplasmic adaptor subunit n=1 Tax=Plebeiibacterium sediminum TaxID=2992112 RepID=A0AAE3M493_9BACT|nr:efflux RND transporter periplasmic adaptor subunit [Plebeiobacterium sediminum]MCW3786726.1 efflux RND transporter periplasmic adaptor subunit [Plebeiobacterium sediminum]